LVDREILATRLSKLRVALRRLDPIAKKTREDYHNVLYDVLQQDLRDLEEFAVAVGKSLDPEE
jgi:hypothetical protein